MPNVPVVTPHGTNNRCGLKIHLHYASLHSWDLGEDWNTIHSAPTTTATAATNPSAATTSAITPTAAATPSTAADATTTTTAADAVTATANSWGWSAQLVE